MKKHREREGTSSQDSTEISRRSLLSYAFGGATAMAALRVSKLVLASHFGTPHIIDVVTDFGAVGDGVTDDAPAFQAALAAVAPGGGTVIVPSTSDAYLLGSTVEFKRSGTKLVGLANPGIAGGPTLLWGGPPGGTMLKVPNGHHEPFIRGLRLDGDGSAGVCLHVEVHQESSTHYPRLEDLMFRGYQGRGLVLGEDEEIELRNGLLRSVTAINLHFQGGGPEAIGILVNAQNAEWVSFLSLFMDPSHSSGYSNHRHHIFVRTGAVNIRGMVSTRADSFAVVTFSSIAINGWRSEDAALLDLGAADPGGPITLENIAQRGSPAEGGSTVIEVRTFRKQVSLRNAVLRGSVRIANVATAHVSLDNVKFFFEGDGVFPVGGPHPLGWNLAFQDVANGIYRLRAPEPTIQLEDPNEDVVYQNRAGRLSKVRGISATSRVGENLRGSLTISGSSIHGRVDFARAEEDTSYFLSVTPTVATGRPVPGSNRIRSIDKDANGFTVVLEQAPGRRGSVTFDWILIR